MRRVRQAAPKAAIAGLGALVVHQLAYLAAYPIVNARDIALSDHSHLSTQWAVITPLAVIGAVVLVLHQARSLGLRTSLSARLLGPLIAAFFVAQEAIESALAQNGLIDLFGSPALWFGVILAPLVGWLMVRALRGAGELAARLFTATPSVGIAGATFSRPTVLKWHDLALHAVAPSRGPPGSVR